jgi:hypothetical protein
MLVFDPAERGVVRVLDFDPMIASPGTIGTIGVLRHQALQAHLAGMREQGGS